jgi:hypothetical protein
MEYLHQYEEECLRDGRLFRLIGLDNYYQFMPHSLSSRMRDAKLVKEKARLSDRSALMSKIAAQYQLNFSEPTVGTLNLHGFIYLRRGDMRKESNVMTGEYAGCHVKLFDYSHTAAPDYYSEHRHTVLILRPQDETTALPELVLTPGNYLERYLIGFEEIDTPEIAATLREHRLYTRLGGPDPVAMIGRILPLLERHLSIYIEIRDGSLLAFCPGRDLATAEGIEALFELARHLCRDGTKA